MERAESIEVPSNEPHQGAAAKGLVPSVRIKLGKRGYLTVDRTSDDFFRCPYSGCSYKVVNSNIFVGHIKKPCRYRNAGVISPHGPPANTPVTLEPEHPDATRDLGDTPPGAPMEEELANGTTSTIAEDGLDRTSAEEDMQVDDEDPSEASEDGKDEDYEKDKDYEEDGDHEKDEDYEEDEDHEEGEDHEEVHSPEPACSPTSLWSSDMVQTEEMGRVGICINTAARIIVCIACRSAVKPSGLPEHIRKTHSPIRVTDAFCQDLRSTYNLCEDPINSRPGTIINAIYGLDLKAGYFACKDCGYAFKTRDRVRSHVNKTDGCTSFEERHAQTFQRTSNRCYFAVKLPNEPEHVEDPLDPVVHLKAKFGPIPFSQIPITRMETRDASNFLRLERWDNLIEGKTGAQIKGAVRDRNPELEREVRICVERYTAEAVKSLENADNEAKGAIGDYLGLGVSRYKLKDIHQESSRKTYSKVATDLLVYALGTIFQDITEFQADFTPDMSTTGNAFHRSLKLPSIPDQDDALQEFLFSIFSQKRCGADHKFKTLAYNFLVLYSFTEDGGLRPCGYFSQYFSKVVFFARAAIFNRINRDAKQDNKGFFEVYQTYKHLLLLQSDYPLSPIYASKNLAKKVSRDQERSDKVNVFGENFDFAVLDDIRVKLTDFGDLYRALLKGLIQMQEDLFGGIGFQDKEWFSFEEPDKIVDYVNKSQAGYYFGDDERNNLKRYGDLGLRAMFHHPRLKTRFGIMNAQNQLITNGVACHNFLERASLARTKLATAIHISVGGPARGTEFTSQYLRNYPNGDIRNLKVVDGALCLVSGYNKTSSITEKSKRIYRFLPKSLYRPFLIECLIIRPTEIILASMLGLDSKVIDNLRFRLFPGTYTNFDADQMGKSLKRDTMLHLKQRISVSQYRDLQTAFTRRHPDPEGIAISTADAVGDLQRGHSTVVATEYYGLDQDVPHGEPDGTIPSYRRNSRWWQHITGIERLQEPARDQGSDGGCSCHGRELADLEAKFDRRVDQMMRQMDGMTAAIQSVVTDAVSTALALQSRGNRATGTAEQPPRECYIPHASLIRMLHEFLRNTSASFKTPEQAEALEIAMSLDRHLLLVGPTAMGKSLVYMLPASIRTTGITCVLLPLSALHLDFVRRCKALKLEFSRWKLGKNEDPRTRIVFVTPEDAQTPAFVNYLIGLSRNRLLVKMVIDEAHLLKSHSDFRFCFAGLAPLIKADIPFLLMTATCPPPLRSELFSALGITDYRVIHAPTNRPEIFYQVKLFDTIKLAKVELVGAVRKRLEEARDDTNFRGLVYCRSTIDVNELAVLIGCKPFHAERSEDERISSFDGWVDGKEKFLVCSSLLGCGIDVSKVRVVYHLGIPWSILDFVQESGRGGRDGRTSQSVVFASPSERCPDRGEDLYGKALMRDWVLQSTTCRRLSLSSFLDGSPVTCALLRGAVLCDVCRIQSREEHPGKLVQFRTPVANAEDIPGPQQRPCIPPTTLEYEVVLNTSRTQQEIVTPGLEPSSASEQQELAAPCSTTENPTRKRSIEPLARDEDKRQKTGAETWSNGHNGVNVQTSGNPLLAGIEKRAVEAIILLRSKNPPSLATVNIKQDVFSGEMARTVSALMVEDVRERLSKDARSCTVCVMAAGVDGEGHESGDKCPNIPLGGGHVGWQEFRKLLKFLPGIICFNCLMPTNESIGIPGALYHPANECQHQHLIRPVLYAIFRNSTEDLRKYLQSNLDGIPLNGEIQGYREWLALRPGDDIPNHIKVYWWLLKYRDMVS